MAGNNMDVELGPKRNAEPVYAEPGSKEESQSLFIELVELCGEGASRDRAYFVHSEIQSYKPPRIWTHHGATTREFVLQSLPHFFVIIFFYTFLTQQVLKSCFPHFFHI